MVRTTHGGCLVFLTLCCSWAAILNGQDAPAEDPQVDREQTIYVPYSKLREVFEKEGRGVFLPYEQFQRLWKLARAAEQDPAKQTPPVDSIITEVNSVATVRNDVVQVQAELTIELLKQGWNRVPLRLAGSAIQSATIAGSPARVVPTEDGNYELLWENTQEASQNIQLQLIYVKAITKSPGRNQVSFAAPRAPLNRWTIRIPQPGVKVNVTPMIAATEVERREPSMEAAGDTSNTTDEGAIQEESNRENNQDSSDKTDSGNATGQPESENGEMQETVLLAFVGSTQSVEISWTPKSEGATGLTALTSVETQEEILVTEGTLRTRVRLTYAVSRAELTELQIDVPADHKVVNVFDPNVRKWEVGSIDDEPNAQRISIQLFEPVSSAQAIILELEKFAPTGGFELIETAQIRAAGVSRQQGSVVVSIEPTLRAEIKERQGLQQLDAAELQGVFAQGNWSFAFRYASMPYRLSLAVEKLQPRISVDQQVTATLQPDQLALDVLAIYTIEQAGVFQLEFDIPADFEVVQVRGSDATGAEPARVDSFFKESGERSRLLINLASKAVGKAGLAFRLRKSLSDPNLLRPTGAASTLNIPIPVANQAFVEQFSGRLVVFAPESLRLNPTVTNGLRATAITDALASGQATPAVAAPDPFADLRPAMGFSYAEEAIQLEVSVERRSPYVTAAQILVVRVEPGVVKYRATILFDILYSGVQSLRVDIPAAVESSIRVVDSQLRDAPLEPVPGDVAQGYVAYSLSGETELIGRHSATLTWEQTTAELPVGQSLEVDVPRIVPMGVDRAWGQILIAKAESLDVQPLPDSQGLRPIDPNHDVMSEAGVNDAARAFEFYADWNLKLSATRYELQEVKRTSIERGLVSVIVTRSDQRSFQALFRIRSARQRLAIKLPAEAEFSSQPARVNGKPVSLERGGQDLLYVPLVGTDPNNDFLLELRYALPGDYRQIDLLEFPEVPAMQKVYLAVFLPEEVTLLHNTGPWSDEFHWKNEQLFKWKIENNETLDTLTKWVGEGINLTSVPAFQTAGVAYLFSTLRPAPPPDGSIRLWCMQENSISGILIIGLVIVGLVLLRASLASKLAGIALILMVAVVCGVFAPTLGHQLFSVPAIAGFTIVAIAWGTQSIFAGLRNLTAFGSSVRTRLSGQQAEPEEVMFEPVTGEPEEQRSASDSESATDENKAGGQPNE